MTNGLFQQFLSGLSQNLASLSPLSVARILCKIKPNDHGVILDFWVEGYVK